MINLQVVAKECMKELDNIGIAYRTVEEFIINSRAKKRWGQCKTLPTGNFLISISEVLLQNDLSMEGLKNTIIHELLHTCKGCMNHGKEWKRLAGIVNNNYGYNIKRTSSASEKGVESVVRIRKVNHKYVCGGCGQTVTRERDRGFENKYTCGRCGGKFYKEF